MKNLHFFCLNLHIFFSLLIFYFVITTFLVYDLQISRSLSISWYLNLNGFSLGKILVKRCATIGASRVYTCPFLNAASMVEMITLSFYYVFTFYFSIQTDWTDFLIYYSWLNHILKFVVFVRFGWGIYRIVEVRLNEPNPS